MAWLDTDTLAALTGRSVRLATLVHLDFDVTLGPGEVDPRRLWNGFGDISAGGHTWKGAGTLGSIDGLGSMGTGAAQVTLTLSGVSPAMLELATVDRAAVKGRDVTVYGQLQDDEWGTVGDPFPIWYGVISRMLIKRTAGLDATRTVSVECENVFLRRSRVPAGRYTDGDQNRRSSGDRFFEHVGKLVNKVLVWPKFS
jgi:hypothetical protein